MSHIALETKKIDHLADYAKKRFKGKYVLHRSVTICRIKEMLVSEAFECPLDHDIGKRIRVVEFNEFRGERLPNTEMLRPPGNGFAQFKLTAFTTVNSLLARLPGRNHVQINASSQIEAPLNGGIDMGEQFDSCHTVIRVLPMHRSKYSRRTSSTRVNWEARCRPRRRMRPSTLRSAAPTARYLGSRRVHVAESQR